MWRESRLFALGGISTIMAGFDDPGVFYSDSLFSEGQPDVQDVSRTAAQKRFKEFIKTFIDHHKCFCYRYIANTLYVIIH